MAPALWWMIPMGVARFVAGSSSRWRVVALAWLAMAPAGCTLGEPGEPYTWIAWDTRNAFHLAIIAGMFVVPLVACLVSMRALAAELAPARGLRHALRIAAFASLLLAWSVAVAWSFAAGRAVEWEQHRWPLAVAAPPIPDDEATRARGEHLARGIAGCTECHGQDFGVATSQDIPLVATVNGPNLTRGAGGVVASFHDEDWWRVLRRGVKPDGRTLRLMPMEGLARMSDDDVIALVAFLKTLPPVERTMPEPVIGPVGQVVWTTGVAEMGSARAAARAEPPPETVPRGRTPEYGRYLVATGGCTGCHGASLRGGPIPGAPSSVPPATDLTSTGPLASWTEEQFMGAMRTGVDPTGHRIDAMMPWRKLGALDDDELGAVWLALRSASSDEAR